MKAKRFIGPSVVKISSALFLKCRAPFPHGPVGPVTAYFPVPTLRCPPGGRLGRGLPAPTCPTRLRSCPMLVRRVWLPVLRYAANRLGPKGCIILGSLPFSGWFFCFHDKGKLLSPCPFLPDHLSFRPRPPRGQLWWCVGVAAEYSAPASRGDAANCAGRSARRRALPRAIRRAGGGYPSPGHGAKRQRWPRTPNRVLGALVGSATDSSPQH